MAAQRSTVGEEIDTDDEHTIVLARWTGRRKAGSQKSRAVDSFDVVICPDEPLRVGKFIHVLGVSPTFYWDLEYANRPRYYDAYDPHIFGPIIAIKKEYESTIELVVHNLRIYTSVDVVYLTMEKIPGMTVAFDDASDRRRWKNKESDGPERCVKIEWDAVVTDRSQLKVLCNTYPEGPEENREDDGEETDRDDRAMGTIAEESEGSSGDHEEVETE